MWGPVKPSPRPSGTALAAPCHSPYQSPLAAMPELQAAHLALGCPPVKPERKTPPQSRVGAVTAPTGAPATTDDWLPCVGACNLIGREAKLGAYVCGGNSGGNHWRSGQAEPESQGFGVCSCKQSRPLLQPATGRRCVCTTFSLEPLSTPGL